VSECVAHSVVSVTALDGFSVESVCVLCGEVQDAEPTLAEKDSILRDGEMSPEKFASLRYGPPTPQGLESFLLPTLRRIKCRDLFVDAKILAKLRVYTALLRVCNQHGIPEIYGQEAMRALLRSGSGVHSRYDHVRHLIDVISAEPRLRNRIPGLRLLLSKREQPKEAMDNDA
jgi:hypothetical protein